MDRRSLPRSGYDHRWVVAAHESGHVLLGWMDPFTRVTRARIGTSAAEGTTYTRPSPIHYPERLWYLSAMQLAGMAAELLYYRRIRSGPNRNDLTSAVESIRELHRQNPSGRSPWMLGPPPSGLRPSKMIREGALSRFEQLGLDEAFYYSRLIVDQHQAKLEELAEALLAQGTLNETALSEILGAQFSI